MAVGTQEVQSLGEDHGTQTRPVRHAQIAIDVFDPTADDVIDV